MAKSSTSRKGSRAGHAPSRRTSSAGGNRGNGAGGRFKPHISRLSNDVRLVAPPGCYASVLLKLVDREDGRRWYSWWAMAGRHDMDNVCVSYKYTGEDTIRFDLPFGMPLSESALQSHLAQFLARERDFADDPPIIIRD
jgi:hypothetical protein